MRVVALGNGPPNGLTFSDPVHGRQRQQNDIGKLIVSVDSIP